MTYYIMMDGDKEQDMQYSSNILGEDSFGVFYPEQGMDALTNIVNNAPSLLPTLRIITDTGKNLTLTEFFDVIATLRIKKR